MPSNVVWFERLMIGSVIAGFIGVLLLWQRVPAGSATDIVVALILIVVNFGLLLLLIWIVARRRKGWVRYVIGALFLLGLPYAVRDLPSELSAQPVEGALSALRIALQAVALVLVFIGNARAWFARQPPPP
jgi:hypothetical protein